MLGYLESHTQISKGLLPADTRVILVGDSEFGSVAVLKQLETWHWGYVLRQKGNTRVQLPDHPRWRRFETLTAKGERPRWMPDARLTRQHGHPVPLVAWWKADETEPWLLATNLSSRETRCWPISAACGLRRCLAI
jgi:hypothetical protein